MRRRFAAALLCAILSATPLFSLSFVSDRASAPPVFTFAAAGDYSFGSDWQGSLDALGTSGADFLLALGDLSYGATTEQNWCQALKGAMTDVAVIAGNHDTGESSGGNINNYVQHCPYTLPGPLNGEYGKEYWFDYPSPSPLVRFLMISPGVRFNVDGAGEYVYSVGSARYNYVRDAIDDARASSIPWVVVGMHKNCITAGSKTCEIGTDLFDLLLERKVDLVLEGHDHNIQRSKQLSCPSITVNGYDPACVVDDGADDFYVRGAGMELVIAGSFGQCCYTTSWSDSEAGYFAKINSDSKGFYTYAVSATEIVATFVAGSGPYADAFTIGGTLPPQPLTASFTATPSNPGPGATVTFDAYASGGEGGYAFQWDFGDSSTGAGDPATHAYASAGTYPVNLTASDSGGNVTWAVRDVVVSAPAPTPPLLRGWGGVRLGEVELYSTSTPSVVFSGTTASDGELTMRRIVEDGFNAVRLYFESPITQSSRSDPTFLWNAAWFEKAVDIAAILDLWVVVDFHGYCDWLYPSAQLPNACTNPDADAPGTFQGQNLRDPWVTWWRDTVIVPYKDLYAHMVWQPLNEPIVSEPSGQWPPNGDLLAPSYQAWISMARAAGDTHWIAVSNANWVGDFPVVVDPLNKILLDRHWYFFYDDFLSTGGYVRQDYDGSGNFVATLRSCSSLGGWGTACAEANADDAYAFILKAEEKYGRTHLPLELGALDSYGTNPPDHVEDAGCSYSPTSLAFLTRLLQRFEEDPKHGYLLWFGGIFGATGLYGCMNTWGTQLTPQGPDATPPLVTSFARPASQTAGGMVEVVAVIADDGNVSAWAVVRGPDGGVIGNFSMAYDDASGEWAYSRSYASPGTYTFTVWARDWAGNWGSGTGTFVIAGGGLPAENPSSWLPWIAVAVAGVAVVIGVALAHRRRKAARAPATGAEAPVVRKEE